MANLKKYDPRLESLVIETKTVWDESTAHLSEADKQVLAKSLHQMPRLASRIEYVRSHTGFTRVITVGTADIERIYQAQLGQ